jgi:phosphate transport system substrate-binding protein
MKKISTLFVFLLAMLVLAPVHARDIVKIDGSSTVFPISEAMAEEFQKAERGRTQVTVGISGTGGGFKKFCRGETDISNASRPIKDSEKTLCKENGVEYIELMVALDALTVVVSPKNDWVDYLTVSELKKIWEPSAQGTITNWKQIRSTFPDRPLVLFGPGTDSGTYDYFVEVIVKGKSSRGDYTASEDDNVLVQGVSRDANALGYFGLAYYEENMDKLQPVAILWDGKAKLPVLPSVKTAQNGTYQPLSRPMFIYVNAKSADVPHVQRFVKFSLDKKNAHLIKEVGYVPFLDAEYDRISARFDQRLIGTVFQGAESGLTVSDFLNKRPQ